MPRTIACMHVGSTADSGEMEEAMSCMHAACGRARLLPRRRLQRALQEALRGGRQLREDARVLHAHALLRLAWDQAERRQDVPARADAAACGASVPRCQRAMHPDKPRCKSAGSPGTAHGRRFVALPCLCALLEHFRMHATEKITAEGNRQVLCCCTAAGMVRVGTARSGCHGAAAARALIKDLGVAGRHGRDAAEDGAQRAQRAALHARRRLALHQQALHARARPIRHPRVSCAQVRQAWGTCS